MGNRAPNSVVTTSALGEQDMDMRIPLEVTPESVKDTNETGSKYELGRKVCRSVDAMS